jgi:hypothetical protein
MSPNPPNGSRELEGIKVGVFADDFVGIVVDNTMVDFFKAVLLVVFEEVVFDELFEVVFAEEDFVDEVFVEDLKDSIIVLTVVRVEMTVFLVVLVELVVTTETISDVIETTSAVVETDSVVIETSSVEETYAAVVLGSTVSVTVTTWVIVTNPPCFDDETGLVAGFVDEDGFVDEGAGEDAGLSFVIGTIIKADVLLEVFDFVESLLSELEVFVNLVCKYPESSRVEADVFVVLTSL